MAIDPSSLPIGQKVTLPGHFDQAVTLEGVRPLGRGLECRVRLPGGSLDETVIRAEAEGGFDKNKLQYGVMEPLREADLIK